MSASIPVIRVTDGITQQVVAAHNNKVCDKLLRALFEADIAGLECIDTKSDSVVFNISCIDGQYPVVVQENFSYKIILNYKGTTSLANVEPKSNESNDKADQLRSRREKSLTSTNNVNNLEFNKLVSTVNKLGSTVNQLSNDLNMLYELVQPMICRAIDPWDITARSQDSSVSSLPKQVIINYYGLHEHQCMICGRCNDVVNVHIWPKHTHGKNLLSMFGLTTENLNDPRNYLRLAKSLELAFDNKTTTVIEQDGQLVLFVLDDVLKKQAVSNTRFTFNDCHLWPLKFGNLNRPFLRILAAHCRNSFIDAFRLKRIDYETFKLGYNSSRRMLNASPDGAKAKIFEWFERNDKMVQDKAS